MAFCTQCGAANQEGAAFCAACGERLAGGPSTSTPGAALVATVRGFSSEEKFIAAGAAVAVLSFFLPWFVAPGFYARPQRVSGLGALEVTGTVLLEPVIAVGAAVLLWLTRTSRRPVKINAAGWQILLGSTFALPGVAALIAPLPFLSGALGIGWWGFTLGYLAIVTGGLVALHRLGSTDG